MELKNKVALITGGGTGLGREIARQLAREGMHIAVNYSRSQEEAEETVAELLTLGVQAKTVQANVAKTAEISEMIAQVDQDFGRLDLLINNAGVTRFVPFRNLDGLSEEDWDDILNVNTKAPFFAARAAAPLMRRNGGGQIINTTSIAGLRPTGSSIAYCASKAAMIHLTTCLSLALAPDIRVNSVAPGLLLTRWGGKFGDEQIEAIKKVTPLNQVTSIEDCAAAFVMLARNGSITGETIVIDSGLTLKSPM